MNERNLFTFTLKNFLWVEITVHKGHMFWPKNFVATRGPKNNIDEIILKVSKFE